MSENSIITFKNILSKNGYRITTARMSLFRTLLNSEALSLREIFEKANSTIDRVSIYRNIELFEKLHIVRRITIGWKYKLELSDIFIAHHHHLTCLGCSKIIDIVDESQVEQFIESISRSISFTPLNHHFEIEGYCFDCVANKNKVTTLE